MGLPSSFMFYALVDIFIRFFDTDLSLLFNTFFRDRSLTEGKSVTVTSIRYS